MASGRVLVTTADSALGEVLASALQRAGLEVAVVSGSAQAISAVCTSVPHAALVDLLLQDGDETRLLVGLQRLRVPAVGLGGASSDVSAVKTLIANGALADFYTRPVDATAIGRRLVKLIGTPASAPPPTPDFAEDTYVRPAPTVVAETQGKVGAEPPLLSDESPIGFNDEPNRIPTEVGPVDLGPPTVFEPLPAPLGSHLPPPVPLSPFDQVAANADPMEPRREITRVVAIIQYAVTRKVVLWGTVLVLAIIGLVAYPLLWPSPPPTVGVRPPPQAAEREQEAGPAPLDESRLDPSPEDKHGKDFMRDHPPESASLRESGSEGEE